MIEGKEKALIERLIVAGGEIQVDPIGVPPYVRNNERYEVVRSDGTGMSVIMLTLDGYYEALVNDMIWATYAFRRSGPYLKAEPSDVGGWHGATLSWRAKRAIHLALAELHMVGKVYLHRISLSEYKLRAVAS